MTDTDTNVYEPPRIEARDRFEGALADTILSAPPTSAVFRRVSGEVYEPPRIEERTRIDAPLVQTASGTPGTSAVFRPV